MLNVNNNKQNIIINPSIAVNYENKRNVKNSLEIETNKKVVILESRFPDSKQRNKETPKDIYDNKKLIPKKQNNNNINKEYANNNNNNNNLNVRKSEIITNVININNANEKDPINNVYKSANIILDKKRNENKLNSEDKISLLQDFMKKMREDVSFIIDVIIIIII